MTGTALIVRNQERLPCVIIVPGYFTKSVLGLTISLKMNSGSALPARSE